LVGVGEGERERETKTSAGPDYVDPPPFPPFFFVKKARQHLQSARAKKKKHNVQTPPPPQAKKGGGMGVEIFLISLMLFHLSLETKSLLSKGGGGGILSYSRNVRSIKRRGGVVLRRGASPASNPRVLRKKTSDQKQRAAPRGRGARGTGKRTPIAPAWSFPPRVRALSGYKKIGGWGVGGGL